MCHYKHLTLIEREKILFFYAQGKSVTFIAGQVGRNKSTISREIRRNTTCANYIPSIAHSKYQKRRKACRRRRKLENPSVFNLVRDRFLRHQWSPEQIAGRLRKEFGCTVISYNTIYRGIYAGMFNPSGVRRNTKCIVRKLRHHGKKRHRKGMLERRGKIRISHDIEERPQEAQDRLQCGHWESDTVVGKVGKACLVTNVDRKSRYLLCGKAASKTADAVNKVMSSLLYGKPLYSVTPDRGKEFAKHEELSENLDNVKFYFPKPHQPWQRGTNENTNGLLREYFPKGKDITDIPNDYILSVMCEMNFRPRKVLEYQTPYEVFFGKSLHLV